MAFGPIARVRLRGQLFGCVVQVLALGWLVIVALLWAGLYPLLPYNVRDFVAVLALGSWMGTLIPAVIVGSLVVTFRRNRALDRAFASLGAGRRITMVARGWGGEIEGREVHAWFDRGPQLEIYVACNARTRGAVGRDLGPLTGTISAAAGRETIAMDGGWVATGADVAWMRRFVGDPGVRAAIGTLLEDDGHSLRALSLQPDAMKLTLRYVPVGAITEDAVQRWLAGLQAVARVVDGLEPPSESAEASALESKLRTDRGGVTKVALAILAAVLLLMGCAGGLPILAVLLLG